MLSLCVPPHVKQHNIYKIQFMVACVLQQALDLVKQYLAVSHRMPPYATQKRRVSVGRQNAEYISGIAFLSAVPSSLLPFTVL